jgi:hypothetical protein
LKKLALPVSNKIRKRSESSLGFRRVYKYPGSELIDIGEPASERI